MLNNKYISVVFLILLLTAGLILWIIKPAWLMQDGKAYIYDTIPLQNITCSRFIDHESINLVIVANKGDNMVLKYVNTENGSLKEIEYINTNTYNYGLLEYNNSLWLCTKNDLETVNLMEIGLDDITRPPVITTLPNPPWRNNLLQQNYQIADITLKGVVTVKDLDKRFELSNQSGYELRLSAKASEQIRTLNVFNYEESELLADIALYITEQTGTKASKKDVFCLISNINRSNWFINCNRSKQNCSIMTGNISAVCDLDNNGQDEFLIFRSGSRFMPGSIQCLEISSKKLLWERALYETIIDLEVADLDGDGYDELVLGTCSQGQQHGSAWFKVDDAYSSLESSLLILDHNGKTKEIAGRSAHYVNGNFGWWTRCCILPDKRILYGRHNSFDPAFKHLQVLDPATGIIDSLSLKYLELIDLSVIQDEITVWYKNKDQLYRALLNQDLTIKKISSAQVERRLSLPPDKSWFYYQNKKYLAATPLTIFDDNLNLQYQNPDFGQIKNIQNYNGNIYFNANNGDISSRLVELRISPNQQINYLYLILWLLLINGSLVYILTRAFFILPDGTLDGSYAVLYNILGIFYNWRIYGPVRIFRQPLLVCLRRSRFENMMQDLTDSYQEVNTRNLGLIKLHFYKINIGNEMHIIQRVAHDIKNQIHLINMSLMEKLPQADPELQNALQLIYKKSSMLSDFSRLNLMKKAQINLLDLIDEMLLSYSSHPRFSDIKLDLPNLPVYLMADYHLINIALVNLLQNSIDYSPQGSQILLRITDSKETVEIFLENQLLPSDKKPTEGSGIGLSVTTRIITAHAGVLQFNTGQTAQITITLTRQ